MQVDGKKLFLAFLFFVSILFAVGYQYHTSEKEFTNKHLNETLVRAVESAQFIIGNNYHSAIFITPPSAIEDANMIQMLTTLANTQGVSYIYSMILDPQENLRFTSSSARKSELLSGKELTHYYDIYPKNELMIKALKNNQTVVDMDAKPDKWGNFRSIYIPHTTPSGQRYIIGADIDVNEIQKSSNASAFTSIASSIVVIMGLFPFLLLYRHTLRKSNKILEEKIAWATEELRLINESLEEKVDKKTHEMIENLYHDTLTGLPNRLKFQEELTRLSTCTIAILNIDDFKEVNDFFGIDAGDDILKQIANWFIEIKLQPYRIGGDEFGILFSPGFTEKEVENKVGFLLSTFVNKFFMVGDESVHLRATIGVSFQSDKPLMHANIALNKARALKKMYSFYKIDEGIENQYKLNISISAEIREALSENRIICEYQPIVNTQSGIIDKYETLVRIRRHDGTLIPPSDFLMISQKTKLYSNITHEVINQACRTFRNRHEKFSINLLSSDILNPYTVSTIERVLKQTGTADRVVFEILESEGIENFEEVAIFIARMKELGASIAIDDFGSGYSNFENILKLNVDFLKIDGSLIRTIDTNTRHRIVVESIVDFARRIGIETIAEFVASEEIFKIVKELGINYSQGYYTGKSEILS